MVSRRKWLPPIDPVRGQYRVFGWLGCQAILELIGVCRARLT